MTISPSRVALVCVVSGGPWELTAVPRKVRWVFVPECFAASWEELGVEECLQITRRVVAPNMVIGWHCPDNETANGGRVLYVAVSPEDA